MNLNMTDITVIMDRSGSMAACQAEAENGVNHFIEKQKKIEGKCFFSLVHFDTEYEFVHKGVPISEVKEYILKPRGMTALLDAVGRAVNETGERLAKMDEADRPGLVIFAIITDGVENASKEFTKTQIKEMVERQQRDYNWQFTFLAANVDAFAEAASIGIIRQSTATYNVNNVRATFTAASDNVIRMRKGGMQGQVVNSIYTSSEREAMVKDGDKD